MTDLQILELANRSTDIKFLAVASVAVIDSKLLGVLETKNLAYNFTFADGTFKFKPGSAQRIKATIKDPLGVIGTRNKSKTSK